MNKTMRLNANALTLRNIGRGQAQDTLQKGHREFHPASQTKLEVAIARHPANVMSA
jgi:hypothetical protein